MGTLQNLLVAAEIASTEGGGSSHSLTVYVTLYSGYARFSLYKTYSLKESVRYATKAGFSKED
jgi:hypothetical protein